MADSEAVRINRLRKCCLGSASLAGLFAFAHTAHADPEVYGGYSVGGLYSSDAARTVDEELDGSAVLGRIYVGASFDAEGDETRFEASSGYYAYLDRENRWTNRVEAEQMIGLGKDFKIFVEAAGATNLVTLERRGTDQAGAGAGLEFERGDHRVSVAGALRRRWYEGGSASSWAPRIEAAYRYRIGSWHSAQFEAASDWVNSDLERLNYGRLQLGGYYTRPLARRTRVRAGLVHRRWTWDARLTPEGEERRERLWIPQIRLTHRLPDNMNIDLDYRHVIRTSNDEQFDRSGNRVSLTFRNAF